jgi:hypothetical protein
MDTDDKDLRNALETTEQRAQKYAAELENLRIKYAEDVFAAHQAHKKLQEHHHHLQSDYENLRLRKGGFGFKMLLFVSGVATVMAVAMCWVYLRLRPKPEPVAAFAEFRQQHQFSIEYALSHREYREAEKIVEEVRQQDHYKVIDTETQFALKLIRAAGQGCIDK